MKKPIKTDRAPTPNGSYSQAVQAGNFIYFSGQLPISPATGELVEGDIAAQTKQAMDNLAGILASQKMMFDSIVEITIYLTNINDLPIVDAVYSEYFDINGGYPARKVAGVSALPSGANVEVSAISRLL